jgi:hypothetical protein
MIPPVPGMRRMCCSCGCGRWYYVERLPGRPREYATGECARKARRVRRAERPGGNAHGPADSIWYGRRAG